MKHDKKPDKKGLKHITKLTAGKIAAGKIAAGAAASVAVLAGGVHAYKGYQNGSLFRPESFVSNHDYQENQIMFPEKNDYGQTPQTDTSDDNRKLERDPKAEDSYGKDRQHESELRTAPENGLQTDLQNANNVLIDPGNLSSNSSELPQGVDSSVAMIAGSSDGSGSSQTIFQVPSGSGESSDAVSVNHKENSRADHDSDSDSGSDHRNPDGNGGNTANGGSGGETGGTTVTPNPTPTPDPTPVPNPDPTPVVDPDYPNAGDKPSLPSLPSLVARPDFPTDGIPSSRIASTNFEISPPVIDSEILYSGAVLTDWKLLCSVYAFVDVTNTDGSVSHYRLTNYSDNFRIGDFPKVADENFTVNFYFRPNAESEWMEFPYTFKIKYAKVVLLDEDDSVQAETYVDKNGSVCLLKQMQTYFEKHHDEWGVPDQEWAHLDDLFMGWSLTPGGEPLGNWFTPTEPGRYVLYPLERTPLPEDYTVLRTRDWDPYHSSCYAGYLQALLSAPVGEDVLEIPEGIHAVWRIEEAGTLVLPNSTLFVYPKDYHVRDAYQVRDDNLYFSVHDGMLFSKDGSKLLGIPESHFDEVVVPADVTYVELPDEQPVKKIVFSSENPPEIDLSRISGATLVVPKNSYLKYFLAWHQYQLSNDLTIMMDDGEVPDREYIDDGLYSYQGKCLEKVSEDRTGFFSAASTVEIVSENATSECENLSRILFSENLKKLEKDSLSAPSLSTVYILAETPPEIDEETFGDLEKALDQGLQVIVPEERLSLYQTAWSEVLGESAFQLLKGAELSSTETANGLKYVTIGQRAILLRAPSDITSFDDIIEEAEDDILWAEIGDHAFDDCKDLTVLDVPKTVTLVDQDAFTGCESLQLILFEATDTITLETDALAANGTLKIFAFNTANIVLNDPTLSSKVSCYIPYNAVVNFSFSNLWGTSYTFKEGENGTYLYGLDPDEEYSSYLVGATNNVSGAIEPPDGYRLTQFAPYALNECSGTVTISDEVGKDIFSIRERAFCNSGLSGTIRLGNLRTIEADAFRGCSELDEVIITPSEQPLSIGNEAFYCSSLKRIELPPNLYELKLSPFAECSQLESVTFTGGSAPKLESYTKAFPYIFGWEDWDYDTFPQTLLNFEGDASISAYSDQWKYWLMGYSSEEDLAKELNDVSSYEMDWIFSTWTLPYEEDENGNTTYFPEFLQYMNDSVAAKTTNILNEGEGKLYWYTGQTIPENLRTRVPVPDVSDYADTGVIEWAMPIETTPVNPGNPATASDASKKPSEVVASSSDADRNQESDNTSSPQEEH